LVSRKSTLYSISDSGLAYLQRVGTEEALGGDEQQELWTLAKKQEASVRESLHELLLEMDAFAFEHLIKRLLEEMDYQNVQVTTRSGDGGVDVVADIELGITSVREVVQAKKHRRRIQRKDLDALRGSLHRFNAVRGTLIATSQFSSGTLAAAFEAGVAPITLIDGDKLVDLLIEHGIGVRKRTVEVLAVDPDAFSNIEE
jgi:restriction system protein